MCDATCLVDSKQFTRNHPPINIQYHKNIHLTKLRYSHLLREDLYARYKPFLTHCDKDILNALCNEYQPKEVTLVFHTNT